MVKKCPHCNHYISDTVTICPHCGNELSSLSSEPTESNQSNSTLVSNVNTNNQTPLEEREDFYEQRRKQQQCYIRNGQVQNQPIQTRKTYPKR